MTSMIRTDSTNNDFIYLVGLLDGELIVINGDDHSFYNQFNKLDKIKHAVVAYENGKPVSCGAIKEYAPDTMEIKRMYTIQPARNKGLSTKVLATLELWASELGYKKCILETGETLTPAIALYQKNGYQIIPNYGQYIAIQNSVCFEKIIK